MRRNRELQAPHRIATGYHGGLRLVVPLAMLTLLVSGCSHQPAGHTKPIVAASIFPLANLVQQVTGPAIDVVSLVPPGISPHGFEINPRAAAAMHHARLIVRVGVNLDPWARPANPRPDQRVVTMADLLGVPTGANTGGSFPNPHLWLDPVLAREFIVKLTPVLAAAFPEDRAAIEANSAKLVTQLDQLDEEYRRELAPYKGDPIVTFHNAFNRLADRYGLKVAAMLSPVESPETLTFTSAQHAIEQIRRQHIHAVFTDADEPSAATVIHNATGVPVYILDELGDPTDPPRSSYQALMRYNLQSLVKGLSGK